MLMPTFLLAVGALVILVIALKIVFGVLGWLISNLLAVAVGFAVGWWVARSKSDAQP